MPERHGRPATLGSRDRRDPADCPLSPVAGLSPEAAARPGAMARLILRRVGITPLLSLCCALVLALHPADPAQAQNAALTARARVIILSQAVRVEQGRVDLLQSADERRSESAPMVQPRLRPCRAEDAPTDPAPGQGCQMIVTDLP